MLLQLIFWLSVLTSLGAGQYRRVTFGFHPYRHDSSLCHSRLLANVDWVKLKAFVKDSVVSDVPVIYILSIKERNGKSKDICTMNVARDGCSSSLSSQRCYCELFRDGVHHLVMKYLAMWKRSSSKVKIVLRDRNLESNEFTGPPVFHKGSEIDVWVNSEVVPIGDLCIHYIKFGVELEYKLCANDVRDPTLKIIFTSENTVTGRRGQKCITGKHVSTSSAHRYEFSYTDSCGGRRRYLCSFRSEEELCTFPPGLRGKFLSSGKSNWTIEDSNITGLSPCRGKAKWDCIPGIYIPDKFLCSSKQGTGYHLMSHWWKLRIQLHRAHMCLYVKNNTHYKYTYHLGPKEIADPPYNENVIVTLRFEEPNATEVCNNPSPRGDVKGVLLRNNNNAINMLDNSKKSFPTMMLGETYEYFDQRTASECRTMLYNCHGSVLTVDYKSCLPGSFFKRISNKFYCVEYFSHYTGFYVIVAVKRFKIEFQCWNIVSGTEVNKVLVNQGNRCSETPYPTTATKDIVLKNVLTQCTDSGEVRSSASVHVLARKGELPVILIMLLVLTCTRPRSEI